MLRARPVPFISNVGFVLGSWADSELNRVEFVLLVEPSRSSVGLVRVELQPRGRFFLREGQKDGPDPLSLFDRIDVELFDGISVDREQSHWLFARDSQPDGAFFQERVRKEMEIVLG